MTFIVLSLAAFDCTGPGIVNDFKIIKAVFL